MHGRGVGKFLIPHPVRKSVLSTGLFVHRGYIVCEMSGTEWIFPRIHVRVLGIA